MLRSKTESLWQERPLAQDIHSQRDIVAKQTKIVESKRQKKQEEEDEDEDDSSSVMQED